MRPRISSAVDRLTRDIPEPVNFYEGLRRPADLLPDNMLIFVRRSARQLLPPSVASAFHQRWVLVIALAGAGTVVLDRREYRLRSGDALLVPPLHLHAYERVGANPRWLFVTFEWPGHTAMQEGWLGARRLDANSRDTLEHLVAAWRAPRGDGLQAAAHLLALLRRLWPASEATGHAPLPVRTSLLDAVRAAALLEPGGKLAALARRLSLSESHLRARFRREAGMSLGRYLREARLRHAAMQLREEDLSVKEAAERAGYPDIHTFSRAFRRALGVPPSTIRKRDGR